MTKTERMASLTLIGTAASFPDTAREIMRQRAVTVRSTGMQAVLETTIERWFTASTRERRPDLIDRITRTLLADDPAVHAAMWDMISGVDIVDGLSAITCPTLILVGQLDPSTPPSTARHMHERLKDSRLHVIEEASHMTPLEQPHVVNDHLLSFLASQ